MSITKADLNDFIAWLKTKPADGAYFYADHTDCLLAQYLTDRGHKEVSVGPYEFDTSLVSNGAIPREVRDVAVDKPHTYGAALERAEASLLMHGIKPF